MKPASCTPWFLSCVAFLAACTPQTSRPETKMPTPKEQFNAASSGAPAQQAAFDPVASIQPLVRNLKQQADASNSDAKVVSEVKFDVKKTDSLINPVVGAVELHYVVDTRKNIESGDYGFVADHTYHITLHGSDNQWRLAGLIDEHMTTVYMFGKPLRVKSDTTTSRDEIMPGEEAWQTIDSWLHGKAFAPPAQNDPDRSKQQ